MRLLLCAKERVPLAIALFQNNLYVPTGCRYVRKMSRLPEEKTMQNTLFLRPGDVKKDAESALYFTSPYKSAMKIIIISFKGVFTNGNPFKNTDNS